MPPISDRQGGKAADTLLLYPLRHRPYRLLFSGQVISDLGDWLDLLALLTSVAFRWHLGAAAQC
ncbi:MAG TPA: hypothetical protein VH916_09990 [Dehalococcoidia bacterium]